MLCGAEAMHASMAASFQMHGCIHTKKGASKEEQLEGGAPMAAHLHHPPQ